MTSFVRNGHPVHLYVYDEPSGVPERVQLMDAAEILPRGAVFRHRRTQSLAPFADWFRYRLLFERGGIWADADLVCLRPFDYAHPIVFAWQDKDYINNAVLGLPARDPLARWMAACLERPNRMLPYDDMKARVRKVRRFLQGNRREDVRWGETGPHGLTAAARHLGYLDRALPQWHFYPVAYEEHRKLFEVPAHGAALSFGESRAVHFWNYVIGKGGVLDKNAHFAPDSPFEQLWARYMDQNRRVTESE